MQFSSEFCDRVNFLVGSMRGGIKDAAYLQDVMAEASPRKVKKNEGGGQL
jgi:hypothetical protein